MGVKCGIESSGFGVEIRDGGGEAENTCSYREATILLHCSELTHTHTQISTLLHSYLQSAITSRAPGIIGVYRLYNIPTSESKVRQKLLS